MPHVNTCADSDDIKSSFHLSEPSRDVETTKTIFLLMPRRDIGKAESGFAWTAANQSMQAASASLVPQHTELLDSSQLSVLA